MICLHAHVKQANENGCFSIASTLVLNCYWVVMFKYVCVCVCVHACMCVCVCVCVHMHNYKNRLFSFMKFGLLLLLLLANIEVTAATIYCVKL